MAKRSPMLQRRAMARRWFLVAVVSSVPLLARAGHGNGLRRESPVWYTEPQQQQKKRHLRRNIPDNRELENNLVNRGSDSEVYSVTSPGRLARQHLLRAQYESDIEEDLCDVIRMGASVPDCPLGSSSGTYEIQMNLVVEKGADVISVTENLRIALQKSAAPRLAGCDGAEDGERLFAVFSTPRENKRASCPASTPTVQTDCVVVNTEVEVSCIASDRTDVNSILTAVVNNSWNTGDLRVAQLENIGGVKTSGGLKTTEVVGVEGPGESDVDPVEPSSSGDSFFRPVFIISLSASATALLLLGTFLFRKRKKNRGKRPFNDDESINANQPSMSDEVEVRTWFSLRDQFSGTGQKLFSVPLPERLRQNPIEIKAWLALVHIAWTKPPEGDYLNATKAVKDKPSSSDSKSYDSLAAEIEVLTWFSLKDAFPPNDAELFQDPAEDLLKKDASEIRAWLRRVKTTWDDNNLQPPDAVREAPAGGFTSGTGGMGDVVIDMRAVGNHSSDDETADDDDSSMVKEIEVRTWYSLQKEFHPLDEALFHMHPDELLLRHPNEIDDWLDAIQVAWKDYERNAEVPDDGTHEDSATLDSEQFSTVKEVEVKTWYSLQEEFHALDDSLFELSADDVLGKSPGERDAWLRNVKAAWDSYEENQSEAELQAQSDNIYSKDDLSEPKDDFDELYDPVVLAMEVQTWYDLQDEFQAFDDSLFTQSVEDLIRQPPEAVRSWLSKVKSAWDEYERTHKSDLDPTEDTDTPRELLGAMSDVHSDIHGDYEEFDPVVKEIEVRTWFSLQDEFHAFDDRLFRLTAEERLNQKPRQIKAWLEEVQTAWDDYQRTQSPFGKDGSDETDEESDQTSGNQEGVAVNGIEVRTWFSVQNEFHALDESLFEVPAEERLKQHPEQIKAWLMEVQKAWTDYETAQTTSTTVDASVAGKSRPRTPPDAPNKAEVPSEPKPKPTSRSSSKSRKKETSKSERRSTSPARRRGSWKLKSQSERRSTSPAPRRSSWKKKAANTSSALLGLSTKKLSRSKSPASKIMSKSVPVGDSNSLRKSTGRKGEKPVASKAVAHGSGSGEESDDSMVKEIEVRTWFALQDEFNAFEDSLFELSPDERLNQNPREVKAWLRKVEFAWDEYHTNNSKIPRDSSDDDASDETSKPASSPVGVGAGVVGASTAGTVDSSTPTSSKPQAKAPPKVLSKSKSKSRPRKPSPPTESNFTRAASKLASEAASEDGSQDSMVKELEVRTWFSLQNEFHAFDKSLFEMPADQRLQQSPGQIEAWLQRVQHAWDRYESRAGIARDDDSESESEDNSDDNGYETMVKDIEVRTWFSLQEEFQALDPQLFDMPADERLRRDPKDIRDWLNEVQTAWNLYERNQSEGHTETTSATTNSTNTSVW